MSSDIYNIHDVSSASPYLGRKGFKKKRNLHKKENRNDDETNGESNDMKKKDEIESNDDAGHFIDVET